MIQFFKKKNFQPKSLTSASEEKYKLLFKTSSDAIMIIEPPDWKFTAANPATLKMFNRKDEKEFTSLGPWDVSPEKQPDGQLSSEKAQKMIAQAIKEGSIFFEWTHKRNKDEDFPATVLLSRFKQNGKDAVQATVRDISKEKEAQEKIIHLTQITKKYLDGLIPILQKIAMGDFSENIKIPEKEDEFTELLVALNLMIDDLKEAKEEVTKREQSLKNAKTAAQNILHDLRLEKEVLMSTKAKDEALLTSIGEGVVAVDADGKIILMNPMAEKMLGLGAEQVMGKSIFETWRVLDEKGNLVLEAERPINIALKGKATTTTTTTTTTGPSYFYTKKDGTTFPVALITTPVVVNNKIIGAVDAFRDITHELEIDRAKTEFVSLASHQLRTPTTAIGWYSEMLIGGEAGTLNKKQKEYLEEIHHGNQRMIDLVNELLSISRIELGTSFVKSTSTNIITIMDDVLKELQTQINEKEIEIVREYEENVPNIISNPNLVRIVFQNLLSNAIAYTPTKGKIILEIKKVEKGVSIAVIDNGCGIPKNSQSKIYSKFFRADNARTIKSDGNGLGLYITKSIVKALNGTIDFISKENEGTTFSVTIHSQDIVKK